MLRVVARPEAVPEPSGPRHSPLTRLPEKLSEVEKLNVFAVLAQLKVWRTTVSPAAASPWQRIRSLFPFASLTVPEPDHCPSSASVTALAEAGVMAPEDIAANIKIAADALGNRNAI
jgi:hypothetical protein